MTDYLVDRGFLDSVPTEEIFKLRATAGHLRLTSLLDDQLAWTPERIHREFAQYGLRLLQILKRTLGGNWQRSNPISPETADPLPLSRVWLPYDSSADLPWEAAHDESLSPVFMDPRTSLVRYRRKPRDLLPRAPSTGLRLLVAISMPRNAPSVNVEVHRQELQRVAQAFERQDVAALTWFGGGDFAQLRDQLARDGFNGLHIVAHGLAGYILWQDHAQNPTWISAEQFGESVRGLSLDFILFTVCDSAVCGPSGSSLVSAALDSGVRAAIGMRSSLHELSAAAFSQGFYRTLLGAASVSLDQLVTTGRRHIFEATRSAELLPSQWAVPVLLLRDDPVRLTLRPAKSPLEQILGRLTRNASATQESRSIERLRRVTASYEGFLIPSWPARRDHGFILNRTITTIGRSTRADIVLDDHLVSPFHAHIRLIAPGQYEVQDEFSRTGTLLNEERIVQARLKDGDRIAMAGYRFTFILQSGEQGL